MLLRSAARGAERDADTERCASECDIARVLGSAIRALVDNAAKGAFPGDHHNGEPLSDGTYYYELLLTRADGSTKPYTGYFSLLR